jgi:hypothetical protein
MSHDQDFAIGASLHERTLAVMLRKRPPLDQPANTVSGSCHTQGTDLLEQAGLGALQRPQLLRQHRQAVRGGREVRGQRRPLQEGQRCKGRPHAVVCCHLAGSGSIVGDGDYKSSIVGMLM